MPMGPFVLADETGIDIGYKVIQELEIAFAPRLQAAPVLGQMIEAGLLGKKGKQGGFYLHKGKQRTVSPAAIALAKAAASAAGEAGMPSDETIVDRLILTMVNEAAMCLRAGIVKRADYLDMALITGIGFPPFRGGLLRYADTRGIAPVVNRLRELTAACGDRFAPSELLLKLEKDDQLFYRELS